MSAQFARALVIIAALLALAANAYRAFGHDIAIVIVAAVYLLMPYPPAEDA